MPKTEDETKDIFKAIWAGFQEPALAAALGDVVLAWMMAENIQTRLFSELISKPWGQASQLYQKLPNYRSRVQALYVLIDANPDCLSLKKHVQCLSKLSKTRNNYIHGSFLRNTRTNTIRLIDLNEPPESPKKGHTTKPHDIENHAKAVRDCVERFWEDFQKMLDSRAVTITVFPDR